MKGKFLPLAQSGTKSNFRLPSTDAQLAVGFISCTLTDKADKVSASHAISNDSDAAAVNAVILENRRHVKHGKDGSAYEAWAAQPQFLDLEGLVK